MRCTACSTRLLHAFVREASGIGLPLSLRAARFHSQPRAASVGNSSFRRFQQTDAAPTSTNTTPPIDTRSFVIDGLSESPEQKDVSSGSGTNKPRRAARTKRAKDDGPGGRSRSKQRATVEAEDAKLKHKSKPERKSKRDLRPTPKGVRTLAQSASRPPSGSSAAHPPPKTKREPWQTQKEALEQKFASEGWKPLKKLSPDALDGIRALHAHDPAQFSTPVLANHFEVSAEAIRRILKSKWRPSADEQADRMRRWDRRGQDIWTKLVELGVRPPKKWRAMGVGKAEPGDVPNWRKKGGPGKRSSRGGGVYAGERLYGEELPVSEPAPQSYLSDRIV